MSRHIRPIRIEGNLAYVPLTQGYEAVIDIEDVGLAEGWNWYAKVYPRVVYAARRCKGPQREVKLHRLICDTSGGLHVDHIDGNGLNNRRSNLRACTQAENNRNTGLRSNNKSGYKGVHLCKVTNKWRASIRLDGRVASLGLYEAPEAAYAAYCKHVATYHGEFARTAAAPIPAAPKGDG